MGKSELRPLGDVMHDVEDIVGDEMAVAHDMQMQEIWGVIEKHLDTHNPDCRPTYEDGTRLVVIMGHIDDVYNEAKRAWTQWKLSQRS